MSKAPDRIFLQAHDSPEYDDNTWCADQINEEDIEYLKRTPLLVEAQEMYKLLKSFQDWVDEEMEDAIYKILRRIDVEEND